MIHSASFLATGSDIAAAVCVACGGLCLRTSSMTFASAPASACEVDDVAATAAGGGGLRAGGGGKGACWRVAGAKTGAGVALGATFLAATFTAGARAGAGVAAGGLDFAALLVAGGQLFFAAFGSTLRGVGPGLGRGTVCLGCAAAGHSA